MLERSRPRRAFRRIEGAALTALLPSDEKPDDGAGEDKKKPVEDVNLPEDDA